MFLVNLVCRKKLILRIGNDLRTTQFLQNPSLFISSRSIRSKHVPIPHKLTVDYLTNSCGLSPESALKASKQISLKSATRPDSVLSLFNSYGFTKPQITKLITHYPELLLANPENTLKPKLDFFIKLGISGIDLGKVVCSNANILKHGLESHIVPSINYLKSLAGTTSNIAFILRKSMFVIYKGKCVMEPNIQTLLQHGVPQSNISKFVLENPQTLYRKSYVFKEGVLQLVRMGVCPSKMVFVRGLNVLLGAKKPFWNDKMAVYRSFGWSEDEVLSVFKKQPLTMAISVKKISLALEFFMNELKWTREDLVKSPYVILLSLQNRAIPRCRALQILLSKNLIKKSSMGQALIVTEAVFLTKYVNKYISEVPNLLEVYKGKINASQCLLVPAEGMLS